MQISVICVVMGNLVVGQLMERTRTSQGKARPFLLLSAPMVVIAIALLFMSLNDGSIKTLIWIAVSYNLYYAVAYPMFYTSHSSMVSLSTRNSKHRGMLATFSNASASYSAWRTFMVALCVITFVGIVLEYFFTRERITEENMKLEFQEEKVPMKKQNIRRN